MIKKLLIGLLAVIMVAALDSDLLAGAKVNWAGNYAGTAAATYVPGATAGSATPPHICRDINGGAVPPAISSLCWATRTPATNGGAWAFAYANIIGNQRISIAQAGNWGSYTAAGKEGSDTTGCSTYVEIVSNDGTLDLNFYAFLESAGEKSQMAHCQLSVGVGDEIFFSGAVHYNGDSTATTVAGEFSAAGIVYGEGYAEIAHTFTGIDYGAHDPDSVEIILSSDVLRVSDIPSLNTYGAIVLLILLFASGVYLFRRHRRQEVLT